MIDIIFYYNFTHCTDFPFFVMFVYMCINCLYVYVLIKFNFIAQYHGSTRGLISLHGVLVYLSM